MRLASAGNSITSARSRAPSGEPRRSIAIGGTDDVAHSTASTSANSSTTRLRNPTRARCAARYSSCVTCSASAKRDCTSGPNSAAR